jgi:hypothetical protein
LPAVPRLKLPTKAPRAVLGNEDWEEYPVDDDALSTGNASGALVTSSPLPASGHETYRDTPASTGRKSQRQLELDLIDLAYQAQVLTEYQEFCDKKVNEMSKLMEAEEEEARQMERDQFEAVEETERTRTLVVPEYDERLALTQRFAETLISEQCRRAQADEEELFKTLLKCQTLEAELFAAKALRMRRSPSPSPSPAPGTSEFILPVPAEVDPPEAKPAGIDAACGPDDFDVAPAATCSVESLEIGIMTEEALGSGGCRFLGAASNNDGETKKNPPESFLWSRCPEAVKQTLRRRFHPVGSFSRRVAADFTNRNSHIMASARCQAQHCLTSIYAAGMLCVTGMSQSRNLWVFAVSSRWLARRTVLFVIGVVFVLLCWLMWSLGRTVPKGALPVNGATATA